MEMGHLSWPMTHDPCSLPLRMGPDKEGAWHGGTGQSSGSSEQKIVGQNLVPSYDRTNWVSEQFINVNKNKKNASC